MKLRRIKFIALTAIALSGGAASAAVTTHLALDTRTGARSVSSAEKTFCYDSSWYPNADEIRISGNDAVVASGVAGSYDWLYELGSTTRYVFKLEALNEGAVIATEVAEFVDPDGGFIRNVTARQLWPHNKIEVSYEVAEDIEEVVGVDEKLVLSSRVGNTVAQTIIGDTSAKSGLHRVVWDLDADGVVIDDETAQFVVAYAGATNMVRDESLCHRWSFNGDLTDSVGGQTATVVGNVATDGSQYELAGGGNGCSYISLGSNILPVDTGVATVEIWATRNQVKNWARVFDIGSSTGNYLIWAWNNGTGDNDNVGYNNEVNIPTGGKIENDREYCFVMQIEDQNSGDGIVTCRRYDAQTGALDGESTTFTMTRWTLSQIGQDGCYLGHSRFYGDYDAAASYNEVRIWNRALSDEEIAAHLRQGPDDSLLNVIGLATGISNQTVVKSVSDGEIILGSKISSLAYSQIDAESALVMLNDEVLYSSSDSGTFEWHPETTGVYKVEHIAGTNRWSRTFEVVSMILAVDQNGTMTGYEGEIPSTWGITDDVKSIASDAFADCTSLESVTIPSTVQSIATNAFVGCVNLTNVVIDCDMAERLAEPMVTSWTQDGEREGVSVYKSNPIGHSSSTEIVYEIDCAKATEITYSWKVSSERNYDFLRCYVDAQKVDEISGEQDWSDHFLSLQAGKNRVRFVYSKDGSTTGGSDCAWVAMHPIRKQLSLRQIFPDSSIRSVTLGDHTEVAPHLFAGLQLEELVVSEANDRYRVVNDCLVSKDGRRVIYALNREKVFVPESVEEIEDGAFSALGESSSICLQGANARTLKTMIPSSYCVYTIHTIQYENLKEATHGNPSEYVPWEGNLTLVPPTNLKGYEFVGWNPDVLSGEPESEIVVVTAQWREKFAVEVDANGVLTGCSGEFPTVYYIPTNVTAIATGAFSNCTSLEVVSIPDSVVSVDSQAFEECPNLSVEIVDGFRIVDGWVLEYEGTVPDRLVIPDGVRGIASGVFREEFWLEELVLPDSLRVIDAEAFSGCTELRSISFGTGLKRVGDATFKDCISLEAVEFPEGLDCLGAEAFATDMDSMRLKSVSLPASLREIGAGAFARCALLTGVTAPTGVLPCSLLFPASYTKLESFVVPAGVTNVVAEMFKGCERLTDIELPESLLEIGDSAFLGCQSLREIGLPDGVTRLGVAAFSNCMNLRTVGLSKGLLAIEDRTFEQCPMLDSLIVPENVTRIGANIYSGGTYYSLDRNTDGLYSWTYHYETRLGVYGQWYVYDNVNRLTAVYFLGNAPVVESTTYANMPSALKSYVIKGSTGWYREAAPTLPVGGWPTSGNAREITYWQPNVFDVVFDANGGTPATYTAQEITDTTYALPKVPPTREGYLFDGWWTEKTAGARVTANSRVTANKTHTLYAHWQSRSDVVIVNFNPNGGTVDPMEVVYPLDVTFGVLPVPTRIGHTFLGWYTSQVGGTRVTESSSVSKENNELYAHWQPITYTVRFHANGGTGAAYEQTFTYNVPAALTTCRFTLTGFSFTGWSVTSGGEVNFANGATVENLGELQGQVVDLYAVWNAAGYAVRFDGNGGAGSMANQTLLVGASQALSANAFTRKGYVFTGWATTATGSVVYQDGETVKNLSLQNGTTVVLYAVWTPGSYSVRYSANGGTGRTVKNTVLWDQSYTIISNPYVYEHHTFLGWAQSESGAVVYTPGENVRNLAAEIGDEVVLYAVWQEIPEESLPEPGDLLGTDKFGDLAYEATDWQVVACDEPTVGMACLMAAPEEAYDEREHETTFTAQVRGAGTVRFFWKTSCDEDPDGAYTWDRAEFRVDGEAVAWCDGITDWEEVVYPIADEGIHTLSWVYCMDGYPAELEGVEDAVWVGGFAWSGEDYQNTPQPLVEPVISPADGATFSDESCIVTITCPTTDATIYYSTNGRTPSTTETYRYKGPFTITKTTTVKAVSVRGTEKSAYVTAVITKVDPPAPKEFAISYVGLEGATHANPATYTVGTSVTFAAPSAREGYRFVGWTPAAITPETTGDVEVTANWKVKTLEDAIVGKDLTGSDEPVTVPASWVTETLVARYGADRAERFKSQFGLDLAEALSKSTGKVDADGRAMTVWDDYVAGTDPTDLTSRLKTIIEIVDGEVYVSWSPDLNENEVTRVYTLYGRRDLSTGEWEHPIQPTHKFFKVKVGMPESGVESDLPGEDFVPEEPQPEPELGGVQLWEGGPYWAECNIGAAKPEEYGYYFWWGDVVGYKRNAANNGWVSVEDGSSFSFSILNCPTYGKSNSQLQSAGYIDETGNLVAAHDAATKHLGAPWRLPTDAEIDALQANCDAQWTTQNGVAGCVFKGRGAFAGNSIFVPAAGSGGGSSLDYVGSYGYYWSSTQYSDFSSLACYLNFYSGDFYRVSNLRYYGQSVRPVRGFAQ